MSRIGKKHIIEQGGGVEINVMPFIDIFSLLCTFLLFSAVFLSIGIHVVQVPFLSNAAEAPTKDHERVQSLKLEVSAQSIVFTSSWSEDPVDKQSQTFPNTKEGVAQMHEALVKVRTDNNKADKVDLFTSDDLVYDDIIHLLDAIKLRNKSDPVFSAAENNRPEDIFLIPKVVMGSVIL